MVFDVEIDGIFELDRPLEPNHFAYLNQFATIRHEKRDASLASQL